MPHEIFWPIDQPQIPFFHHKEGHCLIDRRELVEDVPPQRFNRFHALPPLPERRCRGLFLILLFTSYRQASLPYAWPHPLDDELSSFWVIKGESEGAGYKHKSVMSH